jgi:hypothetical protein
MNGYASAQYAHALAEWGQPRHLPRCDGWLLERPIAGTDGWRDAMGPYPLFACGDWSQLGRDVDDIGDLVSVTLVTEPFAAVSPVELREAFDHVVAFKPHVVVELGSAFISGATKHHRRDARRALRSLVVERAADPIAHLDEWEALYATLVARHQVTGIQRFSRESFAAQLQVPGIVMFIAREGEVVVGAGLWYLDGKVGYSHLQAMSARGYELCASYALYWTAFHELADDVEVVDIGAGAGAGGTGTRLDVFKRGWTTAAPVPVYLCGRTVDGERYASLVAAGRDPASRYFPAYRAGELI